MAFPWPTSSGLSYDGLEQLTSIRLASLAGLSAGRQTSHSSLLHLALESVGIAYYVNHGRQIPRRIVSHSMDIWLVDCKLLFSRLTGWRKFWLTMFSPGSTDAYSLYGCLGLLLWPVRLLSQLQRLHLVLPQSLGGFSYLTPSSEASPIHNHAPNFLDWIRLSRFSTLASAVALPLLLAIAHDFLRYQIETAIYLIVRINICYPNECDLWSKQIAGKVRQYELMMTRVNLFHLPALARASSRPTTRLHETLRALQEYLPGLHVHIIRIGWFLFGEDIQRVELTPAVEARLKFRLSQIYRHKVRAHRDIWNAESVHDFRRVALERATEEQDLNCWTMYFDEEELYKNESSLFPPFEDIDIDSTATPDPQDLFVTPDFEVGNENATNASTHLGNDGDTARDARRRLDEIISQNMERGPELVVEQLTTVNDQQPVPWTVSHGNQSTPAVQQLHETLPTPVEQAVQRHNQEVGSLTQPQAADFDHSAAPGSDGPEIDRLIRSESPSPGITRAQSLVTPEAETSTATDVMATIAAMPAPIVHLTRPYYGQVIPTMFAGDEPPPNLPPPRRMNPETLSSHSVSSNDSPSEAEAVEPPPRSNGYRTTPLSNFSAEFLSAIAAKTLATLILLPLESLCLRSLTLSFLSHPSTRPGATDAASWIRSDVIPMGVWFGGPVGSGRMRYVGNLALCLGLQATMGIGVWAGFSWISERLGRKRYNWGKY